MTEKQNLDQVLFKERAEIVRLKRTLGERTTEFKESEAEVAQLGGKIEMMEIEVEKYQHKYDDAIADMLKA